MYHSLFFHWSGGGSASFVSDTSIHMVNDDDDGDDDEEPMMIMGSS